MRESPKWYVRYGYESERERERERERWWTREMKEHLAILVSDIALDVFFQSSIFCLCLLSCYLCYRTFADHLSIGRLPGLQICCFRVVAIAPAYAILTWLKLMFLPALVVWKTAQDFCETYAIYCYWVMLILWCGGQKHAIEQLKQDSDGKQTCSLCPLLGVYSRGYACPLYTFASPHDRFKFWRRSMTQLIVVRVVMNTLRICLQIAGFKGLGKLHFIGLVSTSIAMHCIIETYVALRAHLQHFQAEKKFMCIKILVAVALLQPLLTHVLETVGAFPDEVLYGYSSRKWSQRVLGTVSVIQMVVFSLLLSFAFSLKYTLREQAAEMDGQNDTTNGDLERSDTNGTFTLLLSPGGSIQGARQKSFGGGDKAIIKMTAFQMVKIWDIILCHTISDENICDHESMAAVSLRSVRGSGLDSVRTSSRSLD